MSTKLTDSLLPTTTLHTHITTITPVDINTIPAQHFFEQHAIVDTLYQQSHLQIALSTSQPTTTTITQSTSHTAHLLNIHNIDSVHTETIPKLFAAADNAVYLNTLINNLITIELFNRNALLPITQHFTTTASSTDTSPSIKLYTCMYNESITVGLLCNVLYHTDTFVAINDNSSIELIDYAVRQITTLCHTTTPPPAHTAAAPSAQSSLYSTMHSKWVGMQYSIAVQCITLLRYLTDNISHLPPSCIHRLLSTHDILMTLCTLLTDRQPWHRTNDSGQYECYVDNQWISVPSSTTQLTDIQIQLWLCIRNLLTDTTFTSAYPYDEHRRLNVLKMNAVCTSELVKQLPILTDVKRNIESLNFVDTPANIKSNMPLIEIVAEHRHALIQSTDFNAVIDHAVSQYFSGTDDQADMQTLNTLYSNQTLYDLLDPPMCTVCGAAAEKRCSRCKLEWYCTRECQVGNWTAHKPMCDLVYNDDLYQQQQKQDKAAATAKPAVVPNKLPSKPLIELVETAVSDSGVAVNALDEMD